MKILAVAVLSAGLAFPAVLETRPQKARSAAAQQSGETNREKKSAIRKVGKGLLSVALFVAEETAFYLNGAWTIGNEITGEGAAADLKDHVAFTPYPAVGEGGSTVETKQTTGIGLSSALADDEAKLDAALTFFKYWFSEEGGEQWILLTRSPMGVNVDLSAVEGVDPLLLAFLGAKDSAATPYSLPGTKAMQERGWDDCQSGLDTLLAGGSVDEAVETYLTEMSAYAPE